MIKGDERNPTGGAKRLPAVGKSLLARGARTPKTLAVRVFLLGLGLCAAAYLLPGGADSTGGQAEVTLPAPAPPRDKAIETVSATAPAAAVETPPPAPALYGIAIEGLEVRRGVVEKGHTLAHLLGSQGLSGARIAAAAEASRDVFDLRRLRPGQPYVVLSGKDGVARHFIYESSATDYVVFDLGDPVTVRLESKPVEKKLATATASVSSSLWTALQDQGVDPALIVSLDEVLGQSVDLFYLQPEDQVSLVFEEIFVEGRKVGCGRILAARMVHRGEIYNAFYFEDDQRRGYYDEQGRSLQRCFLRAPLKYDRISSGFSRRRLHPILNTYRPHLAIDYAAPTGTPVLAVGDGTVLRTGRDKNAGRFIRLRHGSRYESRYIHLSRFAKGLHAGQRVQRGEVIGYVGQTGLATGPHLDFAFYRDGAAVNYRKLDFPRGEPVSADYRARFDKGVLQLSHYLDGSSPVVATSEATGASDG